MEQMPRQQDDIGPAGIPAYEEYRHHSQFIGWVVLFAASVLIMGWAMSAYVLVPETPRRYDYGSLPDAPGESIYSTVDFEPGPGQPPPQIAPLPEARLSPRYRGGDGPSPAPAGEGAPSR